MSNKNSGPQLPVAHYFRCYFLFLQDDIHHSHNIVHVYLSVTVDATAAGRVPELGLYLVAFVAIEVIRVSKKEHIMLSRIIVKNTADIHVSR